MSGPTTRRAGRREIFLALVVVLVAAGAAAAFVAHRPQSPEEREAAAAVSLAPLTIGVVVSDVQLEATEAIADFGVGKAVRLVRVRIVDQIAIQIRFVTPRDLVLEAPPRFCLVGPFAAPDDAGLSDRCWGQPDLSLTVAGLFERDNAGRVVIRPDAARVDATLRRGDVRCDFPPGPWRLEVLLNPVVDGTPLGERHVPDVEFEIPWTPSDTLVLVRDSRYCGLADYPYNSQGEPATAGGG